MICSKKKKKIIFFILIKSNRISGFWVIIPVEFQDLKTSVFFSQVPTNIYSL